jgi:acetyl-CoA acyltransferase
VLAGAYDVAVACGVEMMSAVPMKANRLGRDELGPRFRRRFPDGLVGQGISAELLAARWHLQRSELDQFALRSHRLANEAQLAGRLQSRIVPLTGPQGDRVEHDEGIRPTTNLAALAALPPAFEDEAMSRRFPEIEWAVTAGNSSPITDGAAATLIMSEELALSLGLTPLAAVVGFTAVGDDPILMLAGVIPATRKLLERHGLQADGVGVYEVNEAFASVVLAWARELKVDLERINVDGGAIAYGHPIGASGGRLLAGLVDNLRRSGARYGLMTMCESGGMANATLLEAIA